MENSLLVIFDEIWPMYMYTCIQVLMYMYIRTPTKCTLMTEYATDTTNNNN